jgi:RNA polymerase sigma factor (sigma-70 family)
MGSCGGMSARVPFFRQNQWCIVLRSPRSADEGDTMSPLTDSQTSLTLMDLLRHDPRNVVAWDRFVRRYHPKIFGWCRAWGLQEADADDVAQDVLTKLTEKMASFRYDQSRCFRAWLKTITQRVLSDLMAGRRRAVGSEPLPALETVEARADLERRIEEIFNRELLDLAIRRVRERVAPATWDAFRLTAFEECTGAEASRLLDMPVASVFVAKHRVQKMLKDEIQKLEGAAEE